MKHEPPVTHGTPVAERLPRTATMRTLRIAAVLALAAAAVAAPAASTLSLGPRGLQTLVAGQLFNKKGRWYLIDDGVCFTYLQSPRTRLDADRFMLDARLRSRLGQRMGDTCVGADFASDITLSGKLRATDRKLLLDDIRIDRIDDEATRNALSLALQLAPEALPRSVQIDLLETLRRLMADGSGLPVSVEQFRILNLSTRPEGVSIQMDVSLSTP